MSHFTVLVVGEGIEQQLAPYQENNMGDCPEEYLEFEDCTEEVLEGWRALSEAEKTKNDNIQRYAQEWHGYQPRAVEGEIRFGYMHNPHAKWDWWQLGGRWSGFFKLKSGTAGARGHPGVFGPRHAEDELDRVDQARIGDIDFAAMRAEAVQEAGETWDRVHAVVVRHPPLVPWAVMRERHATLDTDAVRELYQDQPVLPALRELGVAWDVESYLVDRDTFCARAGNAACTTFAVLKDGEWYERGVMGWWAHVSDEVPEHEWAARVAELLAGLPPETQVSIVDCHI